TDVRPGRTDQPWHTSWGVVGYVRNNTATGPITTTETDITGLAVTWVPLVGRRYRTSVKVNPSSSVVGDVVQVKITDGANGMLELRRQQCPTAGSWSAATWYTEGFTGGFATLTRKARFVRDAGGTGNITILGASVMNEITVEDIGPN